MWRAVVNPVNMTIETTNSLAIVLRPILKLLEASHRSQVIVYCPIKRRTDVKCFTSHTYLRFEAARDRLRRQVG